MVFYYHFAFLAISIALFGLGVGGVFSYVVAGWKAPLFRKLGHLSTLNSLFVLVAMAVVIAQKEAPGAWALALVYFGTFAAVLRLGNHRLSGHLGDRRARRPCLLLRPAGSGHRMHPAGFLNQFGGPRTVIFVAVFFAVGGAIWRGMAGSVGLAREPA